jgi:hypothetical protein
VRILVSIYKYFILLLLCSICSAEEISMTNEISQISGQIEQESTKEFFITDAQPKMTYRCTVEMYTDIGNLSDSLKTEFPIHNVVDKGKMISFIFMKNSDMKFTITNSKNHPAYYSIICLKPDLSERLNDNYKYDIIKSYVDDNFNAPSIIADEIALFTGLSHHDLEKQRQTFYHHSTSHRTYRKKRSTIKKVVMLSLGIPLT